jgi:pimeloyl-ACP methyl ester carboxylesterase
VRTVGLRLVLLTILLGATACGAAVTATPDAAEIEETTSLPAILSTPGEPGTFQPAKCRFILPDGLREGIDIECGDLFVLERRSEMGLSGDSRIIRLAVAIFHPPSGAKQPDPVIYLSGGPGASALELIRYQFEPFSAPVFATGRDLIVFDQRGVGLSKPTLDCPEFDYLSRDLLDRKVDGQEVDEGQASELVLKSLQDCHEALAEYADLSAYNSATSAADVNDLRLALGYDQINLWGGSYGTRLALEVMRRYPEGLRSVVLDSVYPPDVDLYLESATNFERALERLFEACADNPVCNEAYPDLRAVFFDTVVRLNADPRLREVEDPFTGDTLETWMNGNTIMGLTFQLLYDSRLRYLLPGQIYAASQGDYTAFDQARASMLRLASLASRGMMFSVQCHEELAFSSPAAFQEELALHPETAEMYANSIVGGLAYRACELWDAGQAEASANQPVYSDVPTLVMTGEFDPITPPAWGRRAAGTLENAFLYEYPGIGHGSSLAADCPTGMMVAFLQDPNSPPDEKCIMEMREK